MRPLRRILPSLTCLYAIDAVARHMSFTSAARELGLSQPAVSKSIRLAEENLGFELFERRPGGLAYTVKGREVCAEISVSLSRLFEVTNQASEDAAETVLRLVFSSSFVSMWLLPRLSEFTRRYPDITFRISEYSGRPNPADLEFDFSSRLGDGNWHDVKAWEYAPEVLYAVASPEYVAAHPEVLNINSLHKATLLHAIEAKRNRMDWAGWFATAGKPHSRLDEGMIFSDYHSAIHAALLSQGVALGWEHLVGLFVKENRLRCVAKTKVATGQNFYLVTPAERQIGHHHRLFRDWVIEQARNDREKLAMLE